jgi:hypothetical protein
MRSPCVSARRTRPCDTGVVQPTLLNSCARAATAAEARYRIDRPIPGRSARVIALDTGAEEVVRRVAARPWSDARFLTAGEATPDQIDDADLVVIVAQADDGAETAAAIALECQRRGIMMAGLIVGERLEASAAVSAIRPYAPVLLVSGDEEDLAELLTALRA